MCMSSLLIILLCLTLPNLLQKRSIDWPHVVTGVVMIWLPSCILGTIGFIVGLVLYYIVGHKVVPYVRRIFR